MIEQKDWKWRSVRAGISCTEIARRTGTTSAAISGYMSGKTQPSLARANLIESIIREAELKAGIK